MSAINPNPITYKQIIDNMVNIANILSEIGDINLSDLDTAVANLKTATDSLRTDLTDLEGAVDVVSTNVTNIKTEVDAISDKVTTPPETGDITNTDDGIKVVGVHVNTTNINTNNTYDTYTQGVTFEIKSTTAIGIKGQTGMTADYCYTITYKKDSVISENEPATVAIYPLQIAYGSDGVYWFCRYGQADGSWSSWFSTPEIEIRPQFITSSSSPTDQLENEYWCEPLA